MKIALCHNAWHVCGGGELYLGTLAEELAQEHEVTLLLTTRFPRLRLQNLLGLTFAGVRRLALPADSTHRAARLRAELAIAHACQSFDLVIRVATATVPPPYGRSALLHVQVPFARQASGSAWQAGRQAWNLAATSGYAGVIFNSHFTATHTALAPATRHAHVLSPPVAATEASFLPWAKRKPVVLCVGRIDERGHCKRQLELVQTFARLSPVQLKGWKLVVAGTVSPQPSSQNYLAQLRQAAQGVPVQFALNWSRAKVLRLMQTSRIFWHAAGLGCDETKQPEQMEHFGISTVEAMARGCVAVVIEQGGQKEIVQHEVTGYRWQSLSQLATLTSRVIALGPQTMPMALAAQQAALKFDRAHFAAAARQIVQQHAPR